MGQKHSSEVKIAPVHDLQQQQDTKEEDEQYDALEIVESPVVKALRTMTLPPTPPRAELDLKKAIHRKTRIIHGRANPGELHQPLRICIYMCYSEVSAAFEAKCIRELAHPFLKEWCRTEHEITVDIIDIHSGLDGSPTTSTEIETLHLSLVENMVEQEVSPIFLRISSSPNTFGSYVIPSSLGPADLRLFSDEEMVKVNRFYGRDSNHARRQIGEASQTYWLKDLIDDERKEALDFLIQSKYKKYMKTLEQQELALAEKLFPDDAIVVLEMTDVINSTYENLPSLSKLDSSLGSRAPALQTAKWKRPGDLPFGREAKDAGSEKYAIAVSRSYVVCIAHSIVAGLARMTDTDSLLLKELQEHIGYVHSINTTAQHLPKFFSSKLIEQYISLDKPAPPLIIPCAHGGGRTTATAQIAALALSIPITNVSGRAVVPRFTGLTPRSSSLQSFLFDLNRHLCMLFDIDSSRQPSNLKDLVNGWFNVLQMASPYLPLVLVVDVDMFSVSIPGAESHPVTLHSWLPSVLPTSVKMIVVTDNESAAQLLATESIPRGMIRPLIRNGVTRTTIKSAVQAHLANIRRKITDDQMKAILKAFDHAQVGQEAEKSKEEKIIVSPLHVYVLSVMASVWNHEKKPHNLQETLLAGVDAFISYLEGKHSKTTVEIALLSVCMAQEGLSDAEIAIILENGGVEGGQLSWFRVRHDLGLLVQHHNIFHLNIFSSTYFANVVLKHYGEKKKQEIIQLMMTSMQTIVRTSGADDHIAMELLRLLHAHGQPDQLCKALCEPLLFLKLVGSHDNFATVQSLWSALSLKQKKLICSSAYNTILTSIEFNRGDRLRQLILQANAIAAFVDKLGDKELGTSLFVRALDVQERALGVMNSFVLTTALKVATIMFRNKQPKQALDVCRRYLKNVDGLLNDENAKEKTRIQLSYLLLLRSSIFLERNDFENARKDLELVLRVYEVHGITPETNDQRLCAVWGNLANICSVLDDYETALDYYARALAVYQSTSSRDPRKVCTTHLNIALTQRHLSKYDDSISSANEAKMIAEMVWGPNDNLTLESIHSMAQTNEVKGDWSEAMKLYSEAQEGFAMQSGTVSGHIAQSIARCEINRKSKKEKGKGIGIRGKSMKASRSSHGSSNISMEDLLM
eukprot:m.79497 g.79497  ORF g.79497 m.79497 type:complete len:1144 (-) comp8605_c3_seq1:99-3530(-)